MAAALAVPGAARAQLWALDRPPGAALALRPGAPGPGATLALAVQGVHARSPAGGVLHQWPALQVAARLAGDGCQIAFDDAFNRWLVQAGRVQAVVDRPGRACLVLSGLGPGPHELRLLKLGESSGVAELRGVVVPPGAALDPPAPPARQILAYGDSDTVGYGNASARRDCAPGTVAARSDARLAWPLRLARALGAGATVVAQSGLGLLRNAGGTPGPTLADLAGLALPADPDVAAAPRPPAGLVVVAIGANDFDPPPGLADPWPSAPALVAPFARALADFAAARLDQAAPGARALLLTWSDYGPHLVAAHRAATGALGHAARLVVMPPLARRGCHWHLSAADHARIARALARAVRNDALLSP